MMTLTEPGDTPASLANRMLGYSDEGYSKKIWDMNVNGFARQAMNNSGYFAPYRAVWLPGISRLDDDPMLRDDLIHQTEFMDPEGRANLQQLGRDGVDINHMIGVQKTIAAYNQWEIDNPRSMAPLFYGQMIGEIANRAVEHAAHPAEKFAHSMRHLNSVTEQLVGAERRQDFTLMKSLRPQYLSAYKDANVNLNRASRLYGDQVETLTRKFLADPLRYRRFVQNGGVWMDHFDDVEALEKIGHAGKFIGRGLYGFQLAMGGLDVYEAYKDGGDWKGEAVGVISETAIATAVGDVLLMLTPAGWVALIITAAIEGFFITKYGETIKEDVKKLYERRLTESWCWF